jgi:hypothetical protein
LKVSNTISVRIHVGCNGEAVNDRIFVPEIVNHTSEAAQQKKRQANIEMPNLEVRQPGIIHAVPNGEAKLIENDISFGKAKPGWAVTQLRYLVDLALGRPVYVRLDKPGVFQGSGKAGHRGGDLSSQTWSPNGTQVVYCRSSANITSQPRKLRVGIRSMTRRDFVPTRLRSSQTRKAAVAEIKPDPVMSSVIGRKAIPPGSSSRGKIRYSHPLSPG